MIESLWTNSMRRAGLGDAENSYHHSATRALQDQKKGVLDLGYGNTVRAFREKNAADGAWINAGYMVLEPEVFEYLEPDGCVFEQTPMQRLAADGQLMSYTHRGFWQCMDTIREKELLEKLYAAGKAPWKKWED